MSKYVFVKIRDDIGSENGVELFMETENFKIYIPRTYEASDKLNEIGNWYTNFPEPEDFQLGGFDEEEGYYFDIIEEEDKEEESDVFSGDPKEYFLVNKKDSSEVYKIDSLDISSREPFVSGKKYYKVSILDLCKKYRDLIKFFTELGYNVSPQIRKIMSEYNAGRTFNYKCGRVKTELKNYIKKAVVLEGVTGISSYAFEGCSNLEEVVLPSTFKYIHEHAFSGCRSLTSVQLPNSVQEIGAAAFEGCYSLKTLKLPEGLHKISNYTFNECSGLTSVTIPGSVTSIEDNAFQGCISLTSITIPNSVKMIGGGAFAFCENLTSFTIPNGVTEINNCLFFRCKNLTSVTIPNSVIKMAIYSFCGCERLTSLTIPNSVIQIDEGAFDECNQNLVIKTKNPYVIEYCKKYGLKYSEK